jgi:hypothetical protein
VPNVKKGAVFALLLFLLGSLILFTSGTVFNSSGNWVGWSTIGGSLSGDICTCNHTHTLTCRHVEWRLKWEYEKDDVLLTTFYFEIRPKDTDEIIGYYNDSGKLSITKGVYSITGSGGEFNLFVVSNARKYFFKVEQNIDSVPEFQPWTILPLTSTATLTAVVLKRRCT